jgi:hypothetical protein
VCVPQVLIERRSSSLTLSSGLGDEPLDDEIDDLGDTFARRGRGHRERHAPAPRLLRALGRADPDAVDYTGFLKLGFQIGSFGGSVCGGSWEPKLQTYPLSFHKPRSAFVPTRTHVTDGIARVTSLFQYRRARSESSSVASKTRTQASAVGYSGASSGRSRSRPPGESSSRSNLSRAPRLEAETPLGVWVMFFFFFFDA